MKTAFKIFILLLAALAASRIYVNVHWLPDVLGGFALAAATLSLCIGFLETRNQHVTAGWPREG